MLVAARRAARTLLVDSSTFQSSSCRHRHLVAAVLVARESFCSASSTITEDGSVSYLRNPRNGAQVYLVGTAHVSVKSADQVREVLVPSWRACVCVCDFFFFFVPCFVCVVYFIG